MVCFSLLPSHLILLAMHQRMEDTSVTCIGLGKDHVASETYKWLGEQLYCFTV
jgi:hypothetical protein